MAHIVDRKRGDGVYRYVEESYRVPGEKNPRKRIIEYLGRVDDLDEFGLKKKKGLAGFIDGLIKGRRSYETEKDIADRLAIFSAEKNIQARINNTLSKSMSLDQMKEVVGLQHSLKGGSKEILEAEKNLFHDPLEGAVATTVSEPAPEPTVSEPTDHVSETPSSATEPGE